MSDNLPPLSGTLSINSGTLTGNLSGDDVLNPTRNGARSDDYQLTDAAPGQTIFLDLTSNEIDTYLQLINADTEEVIAQNDDGGEGTNSRLSFVPSEGINYRVRVTSYGNGEVGEYSLSAATLKGPEVVGTISALDGTLTGSLSTDDGRDPNNGSARFVDDYQLSDVAVGQIVVFELASNEIDTYLQLINAETGEVIAQNDDGGEGTNSRLIFVPSEGINYRVRVTSDDQGETGDYTLKATTDAVPDLEVSEAVVPDTVTLGEEVEVSWTVTNRGNAETLDESWRDKIYLSTDTILDSNDLYLESEYIYETLAAGESYTKSRYISIAGGGGGYGSDDDTNSIDPDRDWHLLFVTDEENNQLELNEDNNTLAVPIDIQASDLEVTQATAPTKITLGEEVEVSWTVANRGEAETLDRSWSDQIYLSSDPYLDNDDIYLGQEYIYETLAAGESYTESRYISIAASGGGYGGGGYGSEDPNSIDPDRDWYLLFVTDEDNNQLEADEDNNTLAIPVDITASNLEVTQATAPTTVSPGEAVEVSWTVTNNGEAATTTDWSDSVYLSDDANFDEYTDTRLEERWRDFTPIEPGDSYTASANVILPSTPPGSRYLLFVADRDNYLPEADETDNVKAIPIEIDNNGPNLIVSGATAPTEASTGETIEVTWTVTNSGNKTASANWSDSIFLSEENSEEDIARGLGEQWIGSYTPLAPGESYTIKRNVTLSNQEAGSRYLIFSADESNNQGETDDTDNRFALPIDIKAPNLFVSAVSAPNWAFRGETVDVTWTVTNGGEGTAYANWYDDVYLSEDENLSYYTDPYLTSLGTGSKTPLAPGESYTVARRVTLPNNRQGEFYLLVNADAPNYQAEEDETDNLLAFPITVAEADLSVTSVVVPASAQFGETVDLSWTVRSQDDIPIPKNWQERLWLSKDATLSRDDRILWTGTPASNIFPLLAGQEYTQTVSVKLPLNVSLADGNYHLIVDVDSLNNLSETDENNNRYSSEPLSLTAPPLPDLIVSQIASPIEGWSGQQLEIAWTVTNQGDAAASGTWTDKVYLSSDSAVGEDKFFDAFSLTGTLAPGESVERRQLITLPKELSGEHYVVVQTDANRRLYEHTGENNNAKLASQPINIRLSPFPNLQVTSVTAPATAFSSQETVVEWTVANVGTGATSAPVWYDRIWLSLNQTLDETDIPLGEVTNASYLNPGESYSNRLAVTLPQGIDDNYTFIVQTDYTNQVFELESEGDNLGASEAVDVNLTPPPDLQVTSVNAPTNAFSGEPVSLSWTVTNAGPGRTLETRWFDEIYLSTDEVWDGQDYSLGRQNHSGILYSGESYSATRSFTLPTGISGDFYFLVRTDRGNDVYESFFEVNNTGYDATPTTVYLTPPPDLKVEAVEAPASALASQSLTLNYRLANNGATAPPNRSWTETFYLSADDKLDPSTDLQLGSRQHNGSLEAGAAVEKSVTFTLPNDISGNYYAFIVTDSGSEVFELDKDNNVAFDALPVAIASRPADLVVSAVKAPALAEAGQGILIDWTVVNQGTGETATQTWIDRVYVSTNQVAGDEDDLLLASFSRNGRLNVGEAYSRRELVSLPFKLAGDYSLFVVSDADNTVYEAERENNNASVLLPLTVTRQTPDLQVSEVGAPTAAASGETFTVNWTVQNLGTGQTNSNYWHDEVFLSADASLSNDDISLGRVYHSGVLEADAQYSASGTFTLPIDVEGSFSVIVRTDSPNRRGDDQVIEGSGENNNQGVTANATAISLGRVPDLVIESVEAPTAALSRQGFELNWVVSNAGADTEAGWRDVFYLSRDQLFDRDSDVYLGYVNHRGGLASGESYTKTADLEIPDGLAGPFYVFAVTDSGNQLYERDGETNNVAYDGSSMEVLLPPLADSDLVVEEITLPATGVPGEEVTLSYTLRNQGSEAIFGVWNNSIYLSADDQWDINDQLLIRYLATPVTTVGPDVIGSSASGSYNAFLALDAGESYTGTVTTSLPGAVPGNYRVIVRSDILNQVPETDESNNTKVSSDLINVDVEQLELGSPRNGTLDQGQSVFYKVEVPEGETLQVFFDSDRENTFNELYVSYGQVPSPLEFDFGFEKVSADQRVVVPLTQAGTYYILARGQYVPRPLGSGASQNYSMQVETIDFGITEISRTVGDKSGTITFAIAGAKFTPQMTAFLVNEAGEEVEAAKVWFEDSTEVFATFDLASAAVGTYDLKVVQPTYDVTFEETESGELEPVIAYETLTDVLEDGFTVIDERPDDVLINVTSTPRVSARGNVDIIVSYTNNSSHDVAAPLIVVNTDPDIRLENLQNQDGFVQTGSMMVLGISDEGPAGILRPGEVGRIRLRGQAPSDRGTINITASPVVDDGTPVDYGQFVRFLGGDPATESWARAEAELEKEYGSSWSSFAQALAQQATELSAFGEYTHSAIELWSEVALEAWGDDFSDDFPPENNVEEAANFVDDFLQEGEYKPLSSPLSYDPSELSVLNGASAMRSRFNANNAAEALEYFVGQPLEETPPFNINEPRAENLENSRQLVAYRKHLEEEIGENVISTAFGDVVQVKIEEWQNASIVFPLNSVYSVKNFEENSLISNAVKNSLEYETKVKNNNILQELLDEQIRELLADGEISSAGKTTLSDPIYIGNNQVFLGDNPVRETEEAIIRGFDYFNQSRLLTALKNSVTDLNSEELTDVYNQYFGTREAAELALLVGRTGSDTQWIKVNNITFENSSDCGPAQLNYKADVDFYLFDGTTFDLDDAYKDDLAQWSKVAIDLISYSLLGIPPTVAISQIIDPYVAVAKALGAGWTVQQFGWGRPRYNLVEFNDVFTGTIDNPLHSEEPCDDPPSPPGDPGGGSSNTEVVTSFDPNDILGPNGFGEEQWISADTPLNYTIRFENDPELATAPAQVVRITQQLDSDLDFRTFRVDDFGFGELFVDVPDNRAFYQTRLDLTADQGIYVDVIAGINVATGEAFWELTSIDPATGEQPTDPLLGFLPPNLTAPEGDGFVSYSVRPQSTVTTGDVIDAEATIIFDRNEPIDTPAIFNTLDVDDPTSTVNSLPDTVEEPNFLVSWSGSDAPGGSALESYTIYVSENGGAFVPWLEDTTLTEATYTGEAGHSYAFYSVATDYAGNVQDITNQAQTVTQVAADDEFNELVGTPRDDVLTGTGGRDRIEGDKPAPSIALRLFQDNQLQLNLFEEGVLVEQVKGKQNQAVPNALERLDMTALDSADRRVLEDRTFMDQGEGIGISDGDDGNSALNKRIDGDEVLKIAMNVTEDYNSATQAVVGVDRVDIISSSAGSKAIKLTALKGDRVVGAKTYTVNTRKAQLEFSSNSLFDKLHLQAGNQDTKFTFRSVEFETQNAGDDWLDGQGGADQLFGGLGDDTLIGGAGDDLLSGGWGDDELTGGSGADRFVFDSPDDGVDRVTDFSVGDDTLVFSAAGFGEDLTEGTVKSEQYVLGSGATTVEHRFIYDSNNGDLFYDSDGVGNNQQVQMARLGSGLALSNDDLLVGL